MRTLVYNTIRDSIGVMVGNRIYQSGATGVHNIPASPEKPFVIYSELTTGPFFAVSETSDAEEVPFQVWVYDDQGSYIGVTEILRRLRDPLLALVGETSPTGARCLGVTWGGLSQDFTDPEFEASVRFATFTMTGSHHKEA